MSPQESASAAIGSLTSRQRDVMTGIARGMTKDEIADDLGISRSSVDSYRQQAYERLGICKAAQAGILCTLAGLVTDWRVGA